MTLPDLITWLLTGRDEQTLSADWLRDKMPQHASWTASQMVPGMALITADTKATAEQRFWARLAEKAEQKRQRFGANVAQWKTR